MCSLNVSGDAVYGQMLGSEEENEQSPIVNHFRNLVVNVDKFSQIIIYRALKDLNGIPGAKDLIVCLTGYQRPDRDEVMTIVGFMGAQFSKPLVASKVTHLVCYKFEGHLRSAENWN